MNEPTIPVFASHYSIGRSILTLDDSDEIRDNYPVSICALVKKFGLKEVFLAETSMSGFIQAFSNIEKAGALLRFGYKVVVCNDVHQKDDGSFLGENKVIVWARNTKGYHDLTRLYSHSSTEGFYYENRTDWQNLQKYWTENLALGVPFYDSFLFKNALTFANIVPNFGHIKPTFFLESKGLPFDHIIENKVTNYAQNNNLPTQRVDSIFYYKKKDFLAYLTARAINKRASINAPNLEHMSVDTFSFESWTERQGISC
jgi:DNA polymerase III alpha subunit